MNARNNQYSAVIISIRAIRNSLGLIELLSTDVAVHSNELVVLQPIDQLTLKFMRRTLHCTAPFYAMPHVSSFDAFARLWNANEHIILSDVEDYLTSHYSANK